MIIIMENSRMSQEALIYDLRNDLENARKIIQKQNHALEQVCAVPRPCAMVLHHERNGTTAFISFENKTIEVGVNPSIQNNIKAGDTVVLSQETMAIIDHVRGYSSEGMLVLVEEVIGNKCKVEFGGLDRLVSQGIFSVQRGDRIIVDNTCSVIMENLGKEENTYKIEHSHGITWNHIGGLEEAKRDIIESIIEPIQEADLYRFYGRKQCKGILLYGPPRCGKTLLVKAATTAVGEAFGLDALSSGFIYIKGPELLSKYVGVAEGRVNGLFRRTKAYKKATGIPAILFIDEAEAVMSKRGSGISSDINNTIVPAFLSEMDGLEDSGAIVILATNRSDILDPAIVGPGRIDKKIHVGRPDAKSAMDIFNVHLQNIPLAPDTDREQLVEVGTKEIFCPRKKLYEISLKGKFKNSRFFTLGHLCSGGMIAEIVQTASANAMRRNKHEKSERSLWGVQSRDIIEAVKSSFMQDYHLDHTDDVSNFIAGFRKDVQGVEKVVI